jgi:hypothetical protein
MTRFGKFEVIWKGRANNVDRPLNRHQGEFTPRLPEDLAK